MTKLKESNILYKFCKEFKKSTNCSDLELTKFIEFLDNEDQSISKNQSIETSF